MICRTHNTGLPLEICNHCLVKDTAICACLEEKALNDLRKFGSNKLLNAGEVLFEEGEERKYVYSLRTGVLRLVRLLPDGRRHIMGFLQPGDFVCLLDVEDDYYTMTVESVVPSALCCYSRDVLEKMAAQYPPMRAWLLEKTRELLRYARHSQLVLSRLTPLEKIAGFLVGFARRSQLNGSAADPLCLPMNRSDIADHLGLTVETVSRMFSRLKAQGVIRLIATNLIEIVDYDALCTLAAADENFAVAG
ncbi:MAG: Crp/Fnr family transcriptional regulator [Candidatus Tokpelaia hoelldobleri]|uniref:Crp/Fnr family transcriptional regulator n=1 Tax=Candidatus Tokpelaia hoelldobleri TaxID=1902579 RepID=A0A1U9JVR5_9HYPH|nr:MAG: Crp/Fnr family transcriptional regulator [Candidatus Tokpelaia hoelldoblerii]